MSKRIVPYICVQEETSNELIDIATDYENNGTDEILFSNAMEGEVVQEEFLMAMKAVIKSTDLPVIVGIRVKRFEDVKKAFYTGAKAVVIRYAELENKEIIKESIQRFGVEQIMIELPEEILKTDISLLHEYGVVYVICNKHDEYTLNYVKEYKMNVYALSKEDAITDICEALQDTNVVAVVTRKVPAFSMISYKQELKDKGIDTNTFESKLSFDEFKLDSHGLIPVIVQDYKTNEVLMLAYMNRESFNTTIRTGRMTYYSRSRQELWIKGETSGHYQYVKQLSLDCDKDTVLAKVRQVGAACHTGSRSCFYTELMKKDYDNTNPFSVFEDVYDIIMDRKEHPKEGSYTNYLFDKGIDKILKKCGEEATEIIIAAKNPEPEELKYEIADFLYHCMVLMAERGVDWKDITKELSHRR